MIPRAAIIKIIHGQIGQAYRLGVVTKREFWQRAQEIAGVPFDAAGLAGLWHSPYRLNEDVRAVLFRVKERCRIGALSGSIQFVGVPTSTAAPPRNLPRRGRFRSSWRIYLWDV